MPITNTQLAEAQKQVSAAPTPPIPIGPNKIPNGGVWSAWKKLFLLLLGFIRSLQNQITNLVGTISVQEGVLPPITDVAQLRFNGTGVTVTDLGGGLAEVDIPTLDPSRFLSPARMATTGVLPGGVYTPGAAVDGSGDTLSFTTGPVDGVAPVVGDRVLVKDEASAANGVWIVDAVGASVDMSRAADYRGVQPSGVLIYIQEGTANGDLVFAQITPDGVVQVGGPAGDTTVWSVYPISASTPYFVSVPSDFPDVPAALAAGARRIFVEAGVYALAAPIGFPADEEVFLYGPGNDDFSGQTFSGAFGSVPGGCPTGFDATALGLAPAFVIGVGGRLNLRGIQLYNTTAGATLIEYADGNSFLHAEGCEFDVPSGPGTIVSSPLTPGGDQIFADFIGCFMQLDYTAQDYTVFPAILSLVVRGTPGDASGDPIFDWRHVGLMVSCSVNGCSQYAHEAPTGPFGVFGGTATALASELRNTYMRVVHLAIASPARECVFDIDVAKSPDAGGLSLFVPLVGLFDPSYFSAIEDCTFNIDPDTTTWPAPPYSIPAFDSPFGPIALRQCTIRLNESSGGTPRIVFASSFIGCFECVEWLSSFSSLAGPLGNAIAFTTSQISESRFSHIQSLTCADSTLLGGYFRDTVFDHCFVLDGGVGFSGMAAFTTDGYEIRDCTFVTPKGQTGAVAPTNPGYMRLRGPLYNCRFNQIADEANGWEGFIERIRIEPTPGGDPGYGDRAAICKDNMFGTGILEVMVYAAGSVLTGTVWRSQHAEVSNNIVHGALLVGQATTTLLIATVTGNTQIGKTSSGADIFAGSLVTPLRFVIQAQRNTSRGNSLYRPLAASPTLGAGAIFDVVANNLVAPASTFIGSGSNAVFTDDPVAGTYSTAF